MRYAGTFFIIGWLVFILAAATSVPILLSLYLEQNNTAFALMTLAGLSGFVGGGLILTLRGATQPASTRENILLVFLAWLILPVFAALPFLATQSTASFSTAYFEAVSALTTTGASALGPVSSLSEPILIWRAVLQWLGGLAAIVMTISILSGLGRGQDETHGPLPGANRYASVTDTFAFTAQTVAAIYGSMTLIGLAGIWASGVSFFDSLCLSLTAIATGGFACSEGGTQNLHSPLAEFMIGILMIYGAINFLLHWAVLRGRPSTYVHDPEPSYMMLSIFLLATYFFYASGGNQVADRAVANFGFAFFNATSLLTTTGFWVGDLTVLREAPFVLLILAAIVGGCSVSTAGGIRMMRVILLTRQSLGELGRLAHPHGVVGVHYGRWAVSDQMMFGIWGVFVSFLFALAVLSILIAASGIPLTDALVAAVSILSNIGPLYPLVADGAQSYAGFSVGLKYVMCVGMIIGRLEVMILLSLISLAYWRD